MNSAWVVLLAALNVSTSAEQRAPAAVIERLELLLMLLSTRWMRPQLQHHKEVDGE